MNTYKASNGEIDLATGIGGGVGKETTTAAGTVSFSQWHLLEAAINRTNGTVVFYLDGASVLSSTVQPNFPSLADLHLGRFEDANFYMHGTMDEARIQEGVASPNWVWADYMTVAQNASLQSYSAISNSLVTLNYEVLNGKLVVPGPMARCSRRPPSPDPGRPIVSPRRSPTQ